MSKAQEKSYISNHRRLLREVIRLVSMEYKAGNRKEGKLRDNEEECKSQNSSSLEFTEATLDSEAI